MNIRVVQGIFNGWFQEKSYVVQGKLWGSWGNGWKLFGLILKVVYKGVIADKSDVGITLQVDGDLIQISDCVIRGVLVL